MPLPHCSDAGPKPDSIQRTSISPFHMSQTSFLFKIRFALYAGLLLMAMVGTASYFSISQLTETARLHSQTEERLVLLERLASSIKTGEADLRQYLLTGNSMDLQILSETRVR